MQFRTDGLEKVEFVRQGREKENISLSSEEKIKRWSPTLI